MKKKLEARKAMLEKKRAELVKRAQESDSIEEVRAINDQLIDIANDLHDIADILADLANEDDANANEDGADGADDARANVPSGATRSFNALGTYGVGSKVEKRDENAGTTNSMEYRHAFMDYVMRNKPIPAEVRENANTLTTDVASVIPTVIVERIIEGLTVCGMILPLVTRTQIAAGVVVPTSSVKPVATWVAEGATSDRQKKTTGKVVFSYFKLRCEISMSMEVGTMAINAFENAFVANVVDAMTVAIEKSILAGTGTTMPTGIIGADAASHVVTTAKTTGVTYADLIAMESALPIEYENTAKYFMTKAQWLAFVGMVDDHGQPIARVNYGINGKPERVLLGREVVVHPYAEEMGDYIAGIFDFKDYVFNTIYDLGIQKKQDWETEDLLTKAVMSADGKPVSLDSLVLLKLKA